MNAWTWRVYDTVKARRGMADDRYAMLYRLKRQVWTWFAIRWAANMSEKIGRCKWTGTRRLLCHVSSKCVLC